MELNNSFINSAHRTEQQGIELIAKSRDKILRGLMEDHNLRIYFAERGALSKLSNVKIEFVKKDLKEAILSPLNMSIYGDLLGELKNGESINYNVLNHRSFYKEIEIILRKYIEG
jgi:hypothetical protein